jgi:lipid-binding SYLF domain-containing protein
MRTPTFFNATGILTAFLLATMVTAVIPAQADDKAQQQADISKVSQDILSELYRVQPSAQGAVERAAGYAVFSTAGLKIFFAGGGMGSGMAVNNQTKQVVYMKMAEVQAGLGVGFSKLKQVWVFETQGAFNNFVNSGWEFGGQATLNAQAAGEGGGYAGAIPVSPGVWIYQLAGDGLAASLTVKGSKYYKADDLN